MGEVAFENGRSYFLSNLTSIQSIEISDNRFEEVWYFQIDGLNRLKTIKIGYDSFTYSYGDDYDESKSFHILNCESLESIVIDRYSFSDFAGDFELKNLPQLQSIQIGDVHNDSFNFRDASFEIHSICVIWHHYADLPSLQFITLGRYSFCYSLSTIMESIE